MKKWILAATLAVVLVMGLTACGSQGGGSTASQPAAQPAPAATSSAKEPAAAPAQPAPQPAPAATTQEITEDEAKSIALKDAGFAESDVTITKIGKDIDDGITKFEIDFVNGDKEYSYDIKADTGEILQKEIESVYDD